MATTFEVIDLTAIDDQLRIEVDDGGRNIDGYPVTIYEVKPPVSDDEYSRLIAQSVAQTGPESDMSALLAGSIEKAGAWSRFTADGAPSEEHVDLGIELAKRIIDVRGIGSGKVVAAVGQTVTSYLVWAK